jgi:lysophospholipase L1-like esterase
MPNLVAVGDSITSGSPAGSAAYTNSLTLPGNWASGNRGIASVTLALMSGTDQTGPLDNALSSKASANVLVVWAGTNDIFFGASVADTFALLTSYCQARQAAGWTVVVVPMISRVGFDAEKNAYNALISAGFTGFASALVTLSPLLTADGAYLNGTYFLADGTHPTAFAVETLVAPEIQSTVVGLGLSGRSGLAVVNIYLGGDPDPNSTVPANTSQINDVGISSTNGNCLAVQVLWVAGPTVVSVVSRQGVPFTPGTLRTNGGAASQFFYLPNIEGFTNDGAFVTFSGNATFSSVAAWEIMGADPSAPFDVDTDLGAGTGTTAVTPSFSTAGPDEIVLAVGAAGVNSTFTPQSGYFLDGIFPFGSGNLYRGAEHDIFATQQTGITVSMGVPNGAWFMHAAAFKSEQFFSISGNAGTAGATAAYTGALSGSVTADGSGNYEIDGLTNGAYTVTPSRAGFVFTPNSRDETISGADVTGVDFTASAATPTSGSGLGFGFDFTYRR